MIKRESDRGSTSRLAAPRVAIALAILVVVPATAGRAQQPSRAHDAGSTATRARAQAEPRREPGQGAGVIDRLGQIAEGIGQRALAQVEAVWPDPPEWAAMLIDILKGSQLGPGDGWFRKAVAQTRYDWAATCKRLDRNGDGRVDRGELGAADADFTRLDRDHDGVLTARDFDFSAHALAPSLGSSVFYLADRDGNGKVTRAELEALFRAADSGGAGFLSLGDLQDAMTPPSRARSASGRPTGPSRFTLIKGLFGQEIGSLQAGPSLGAPAPDFTLKTAERSRDVTLSTLIGSRPVVLIFGNFTCGPFRSQAGNVEKLYLRYKDRAEFVMVYVREAHPTDGWRMESNDRVEVTIAQPRSEDERFAAARACGKRLELGMPMLVDTIGDTVGARYSGMPSRLYLLDRHGRVAYKSGRGPFGFKPAELEQSLILLLRDEFPELKPTETATATAATPAAEAGAPGRHSTGAPPGER